MEMAQEIPKCSLIMGVIKYRARWTGGFEDNSNGLEHQRGSGWCERKKTLKVRNKAKSINEQKLGTT